MNIVTDRFKTFLKQILCPPVHSAIGKIYMYRDIVLLGIMTL